MGEKNRPIYIYIYIHIYIKQNKEMMGEEKRNERRRKKNIPALRRLWSHLGADARYDAVRGTARSGFNFRRLIIKENLPHLTLSSLPYTNTHLKRLLFFFFWSFCAVCNRYVHSAVCNLENGNNRILGGAGGGGSKHTHRNQNVTSNLWKYINPLNTELNPICQ